MASHTTLEPETDAEPNAAAEDELPTENKAAAEEEPTIPIDAETEHTDDAALEPKPLDAETELSDDAALDQREDEPVITKVNNAPLGEPTIPLDAETVLVIASSALLSANAWSHDITQSIGLTQECWYRQHSTY